MEQAAGVKFNIVHFQGGFSEHLPAVLGGHVDAAGGVSGIHSGPFKAGQIRLLGIADKQRNRFFPDVPTFKEQGYDVSMAVSRGVMVRAGTPKEILGALSSAIKKAMETERFQKKMEEQFMAVRYMGPEEFSAYWDELEAMAKPLMALAKK